MAKFIDVYESGKYALRINVDNIVYVTSMGKDYDQDHTRVILSTGAELELRDTYNSVVAKITNL